MAFQESDIYTSSGSVQLQNAWTPYVSKFDTSTFYNWEEDNVPLYDLEERTQELWEQAGYPTSSVPGLALTVSADAPALTLAANSNIFTTVSACVAALPKVIRFPVLIEVCNFGALGDLELHNIRIEEGGSIEIINRAYTKVYGASATVDTQIATPSFNESIPLVQDISSIDVSSTLYSTGGLATSSMILSSTVLSGAGDVRASDTYVFLYPRHTSRVAPLSVGISKDDFLTNGASVNSFEADAFENLANGFGDRSPLVYDISAVSQYDSTRETYRPELTVDSTKYTGVVSLNHFKKISVKNCDGPIYIRNFTVDGERITDSGTAYGIDVLNSDIVLENCAVARCREAGFRFRGSSVVLSRAAFSYRNYDQDGVASRREGKGVGFEFINSDVTLSADMTTDTQASGYDVVFCASRNTTGFRLKNSTLKGGFGRILTSDSATQGITTAELNTSAGFELDNSEVDLDGILDAYGNNIGIQSTGSKINFYQLTVEGSNDIGIKGYNSFMSMDSKEITLATKGMGQGAYPSRHQVDFINNGQHIDIEKQSTFTFKRTSAMPSKFGGMIFSGCHGTGLLTASATNLPAINIEDGSNAEFIHAVIDTRLAAETETIPAYGLAARAHNNSEVAFFGTGSGCTAILGASASTDTQAALYGGRNSAISLHGPTVIGQVGVDALVEDNSVLNITPPKNKGSLPDVEGFSLSDPLNHTSVELHALRACLVAHRNSSINMEDLGDFHEFWPNTTNGQALVDAGTDYNNGNNVETSAYTYRGSLQFYPNPFANEGAEDSYDLAGNGVNLTTLPSFPVFTKGTNEQNTFLAEGYGDNDFTITSAIAYGGVCVRAVGGSEVNARNVHFPLGVNDSPLDALYYNVSGDDCSRLMIWNIADTSRMHASFLSVSGGFPGDIGYHGPSAIYTSAGEQPASGAPSSTPDTGALSVLDQFGAGSSVWYPPANAEVNDIFDRHISAISVPAGPLQYGTENGLYNNQGLFRIYFSVDPAAKLLQIDASGYTEGAFPHAGDFSGELGQAYQIFAQGYNCSAPVSGLIPSGLTSPTELGEAYPQLLKYNGSELTTSGFYYCKEFVPDNPGQIIVDESAGNTFANAKNCMTGQSGKPKKVTMIRSRLGDETLGENRGSESFPGDLGRAQFRSTTLFDLERLL